MRDLALLPKADLHVHLESTVRPGTLAELAAAHGLPAPGPGGAFAGFRAFADHNALVRACLRTAGDFRRVAREFCADAAADGVAYAEVSFTAAAHEERLGVRDLPLAAVLDGLADGRAAHGVETRVILDQSRRRAVSRFRRTLDLALAHPDAVAAIGLAGQESYPLEPFADVCARARAAGVRLVHHAGEDAGPASIAEALDRGLADRIGHGTSILGDPALVARVRAAGVPLEVCPSSNVALGLVPSLPAHPLPALRAAGLHVTLGTDVPAIVGTTLTGEYTRVRDAWGWSDGELADLALAGVAASFAPEPVRARLRAGIAAWRASGGAGAAGARG
ncbi:adenosine deaminase [Spirilliplanes yamanashiensis]|uniref:Adenosine deaminase n=1 Tax=Spirilliplanes yamanashiensis TaxID=42233 RepID=A0A8J4DKV9_9ACTN|nr:adenosine deaminase [Spirilliplanes yamanashiensis]MDP9818882.1 adenosine deaminase [Spirilliplanes yamanashiensis]GIJ05336.1 adenosine deaminase [Spirilliplanes yamanashiensis]